MNWKFLNQRDSTLIYLNINSLLPKIDELRHIVNSSNAAVIGISETKLGESVHQSEIQISNNDLLHRDRNRNGEGVASYSRRDISYIQKQYFPVKNKSIFFETLLPKTKARVVEIICRSSSQNNFLETLNRNFPAIDTDAKETYILGDFKISMYGNNKYIV